MPSSKNCCNIDVTSRACRWGYASRHRVPDQTSYGLDMTLRLPHPHSTAAMNSDNITQLLQQGFRVTLGATASLVETLQDPQKRTENLSQVRLELNQLATEWAAKGEMTEQEARNFVNNLLNQLGNQPSTTSASYPSSVTTTTTQVAPPDVQLELQELTAQLSAIRAELEKLRNSDNPS